MTHGELIARLRVERDQLQAEIGTAPAWGAAVSAKQERINGINRILESTPHARLDELGVTGVQRDIVEGILRLCDDVFGVSMSPAVGMEDNGDIWVTIGGVSGTIDVTITKDCLVTFAGDLRNMKGDPIDADLCRRIDAELQGEQQ